MNELNYQIIGKGETIVLVHGFLENRNMWNFLQLEEKAHYQFVLIDLPGHGNSELYNPVNTMDFMAEKIKEILDKENITNAHFIGHSMGGYVNLVLLDKYPTYFKSFTLFFSSPFEDSEEKKEQRQKAAELAKNNKEDFIRLGIPNLFNAYRIENLKTEIEQAKEMARTTSTKGISAASLGMRERKSTEEVMRNTKIPILWVSGRYDNAVDIDKALEFSSKNINIQHFMLPIGHMGHLEAPEICSTIFYNFIQQL